MNTICMPFQWCPLWNTRIQNLGCFSGRAHDHWTKDDRFKSSFITAQEENRKFYIPVPETAAQWQTPWLLIIRLRVRIQSKHNARVQCYKTLRDRNLMNVHNKLECLFLTRLSSLVKCFSVRPGAYPGVEHLESATLR